MKRRLKQHLLLRSSADFATVSDYESWLHGILERVMSPVTLNSG